MIIIVYYNASFLAWRGKGPAMHVYNEVDKVLANSNYKVLLFRTFKSVSRTLWGLADFLLHLACHNASCVKGGPEEASFPGYPSPSKILMYDL